MRSLLLKGGSHQRDVWSECQVHFLISAPAGAERDALGGDGVDKKPLKVEGVSLTILAANVYGLLPMGPGVVLSMSHVSCTDGSPMNEGPRATPFHR